MVRSVFVSLTWGRLLYHLKLGKCESLALMLTGLQPMVLGAQAVLRWSDVGKSCPAATYLQGSVSPEQK